MTFFDKHSLDHADPFYFDEYNMIDHVITTVRRLYGITGAVGLLAGLALLFWPVKTLVVLTVVLGIYFIVAGIIRLATAIWTPLLPGGWRALNIITSLLL